MRSRISLVAPLALLAACNGGAGLEQLPPAPAMGAAGPVAEATVAADVYAARDPDGPGPSDGPQGTSRARAGEERYDRVGHAGHADAGEGVYAVSNALPDGSHAEVTALNTGKTILVPIRGGGRGLLDLSAAAASQLGVTGSSPVRVRRAAATEQEIAALRAGQPAPPRADAPPVLLVGLRKRLEQEAAASSPPPAPAAAPAASPTKPPVASAAPARATRGMFVQVATLSNASRARALADQLGGLVRSDGGLHRVQAGPFDNRAAAERARADAVRRGFDDAHIISIP